MAAAGRQNVIIQLNEYVKVNKIFGALDQVTKALIPMRIMDLSRINKNKCLLYLSRAPKFLHKIIIKSLGLKKTP